MSVDKNTKKNEIKSNTDNSRREAMKKLGSYAGASAVMLSLVASKKASAISPPPPPPP